MPATAKTVKAIVYNRVPSVTADFWLIKLMAVTMGETAADYLNVQLGLGLTATSLIMSAILAGGLIWQFAQKRYVPSAYWLSVVLISIVGTLITDNLVDIFHVPLMDTTMAFSVALVLTFTLWFQAERTLSIHSIFTNRREAFYWLAILFTFALGTAAGDLVAEEFALGYLATGILFGMIICSLSIGYFFLELDPILAFWLVYILTRPLGASFGDLLSQPTQYGGLGLGTIITSAIFLASIVAIVIYASMRHLGEELIGVDEDELVPGEGKKLGVAGDEL
ncbi:hypothetical protein AB4Z43_33275 [Mesorhizobium sp. 2RAF45]|uniref:COG4705 family protein n=1 Tax=Mesorhizobium sp. 2RAF45 TaxID=3233001 RepID=UPI003F969F3F